ncbi:MAG: 4-hydroxy-tetrahydrodipicolinate synthase [Acidimicrobiia bacterium]|nr:4-hydroxy-tetrahydrodipicolinate synthase [Acidimicrobiia bacterium]
METVREAPFGLVVTAIITPFDSDGAVDYGTFWKLVRHMFDTGTDTVLVSGTTGESPTLTNAEKIALYKAAVDAAGDKGRVMAGTGTYNTAESVEMTEKAAKAGVHAIMAVGPYYSKPPQEGMRRHFEAIADATDLPMMIYNIPGRTSRLIAVDTLAQLGEHKNVVAIKDAVADIAFAKREIAALPDGVAVYSGDDSMTRDIVAAGGVGVVSVASHLAGPQIRRLVEATANGNEAESRKLHDGLMPLFEALFVEPSPMPLKAAMSKLWADVGEPRLPLISASGETLTMVVEAMEAASEL